MFKVCLFFFSNYIFETSFAQTSKCKMPKATIQNLENAYLTFQVKDKMLRGQERKQSIESRG